MERNSDDLCIPLVLEYEDEIIELVVTNLLTETGDYTDDPREAVVAVAQMLTGKHAGRWLTVEVLPEGFEQIVYH